MEGLVYVRESGHGLSEVSESGHVLWESRGKHILFCNVYLCVCVIVSTFMIDGRQESARAPADLSGLLVIVIVNYFLVYNNMLTIRLPISTHLVT